MTTDTVTYLPAVVDAFQGFWPVALPIFFGLVGVVVIVKLVTRA